MNTTTDTHTALTTAMDTFDRAPSHATRQALHDATVEYHLATITATIQDMAVTIRATPDRTTLRFATLFQAEQAADLFLDAGIATRWEGRNQPILHTPSERFTEKG